MVESRLGLGRIPAAVATCLTVALLAGASLAQETEQPANPYFGLTPGVSTAEGYYPTTDSPATVHTPSFFSRVVPASHTSQAGSGYCDSCCTPLPCSPWYLSLSGGWQHRETVHEANDPQTFIVFHDGFAANAAMGYRFEPFRIEAEYTIMNNDVETAGAAGLSSGASGNVNLRAIMFNLYHDMPFDVVGWQPYLGAGIGLYQSEINSLYPDFFDVAGPPMAGTAVNTTSDWPLAYQFRLGMTRALSEKTEVYTGYRYFRGEELEFAAPPFSNFAPTFHPDGAKVHSIEFGLRVNF